MEGSFLYKDREVMLHFSAQYRQGKKTIGLNDVTLIFEFTEDGKEYLIVPLPADIQRQGDRISLNSKQVTLDNVQVSEGKEGARTVYELKVD